MSLDEALEWILSQEDYPQLADFRRRFGWEEGTELIHQLEIKGWITIDNESKILVIKITNPKLQKMVDESIMVRGSTPLPSTAPSTKCPYGIPDDLAGKSNTCLAHDNKFCEHLEKIGICSLQSSTPLPSSEGSS